MKIRVKVKDIEIESEFDKKHIPQQDNIIQIWVDYLWKIQKKKCKAKENKK